METLMWRKYIKGAVMLKRERHEKNKMSKNLKCKIVFTAKMWWSKNSQTYKNIGYDTKFYVGVVQAPNDEKKME